MTRSPGPGLGHASQPAMPSHGRSAINRYPVCVPSVCVPSVCAALVVVPLVVVLVGPHSALVTSPRTGVTTKSKARPQTVGKLQRAGRQWSRKTTAKLTWNRSEVTSAF